MDQELKEHLFQKLITLLKKYEGELEVRSASDKGYHLYGSKTVSIGKSKYDGIYFASTMTRKDYTGFYFFPIYTHPEEFEDTPAELRKCLKGKSCFYIKKDDPIIFDQITAILDKGIQLYRDKELI